MTTNELLQEKDNTIRELNEKLQQMSEQIDELKKAVELYRQAAAMARAAQFGSRSEKTVPEGYEEQPLFNEAEQEASPKAKEPNLDPDDAVAKELLKDYHGYLHTDGYKGYNLVSGVTHCYFWVHLRRLFYQASKSTVESEGTLAAEALKMIQELANKEKAFAEMSAEERQAARDKEETPIQEKFWQWIDANQGRCLPKSLLGKAFTYAQNQKDGLMNYLQYGNCDMTNNVAENSIRPFVVGRKNWEFSAAVKGAEASAAAYSIIETAKANGLDCRKYLTYLFEKLSQLDFRSEPDLFERFLPWQPEIQENCK